MNWFERYGIPGGYFSTTLFIICIERGEIIANTGTIAFFIFITLPLGYILVMCATWFHYLHSPWRIHVETANGLARDQAEDETEAMLEAHSVILFRMPNSKVNDKLNMEKRISEWIRKRYDVIAINSSIMFGGFFWINIL